MKHSSGSMGVFVLALLAAACGGAQGEAPRDAGTTGPSDGVVDAPATDTTPTCAAPRTTCDGRCVDPQSEREHCGACGRACMPGQVCALGRCGFVCPPGQTPCDGACVTLATDRAHCGACGTACPAGEVCTAGRCAFQCASPLVTCGGDDAGPRSCADTRTDRAHCGACGNACPAAHACENGRCALACPATQTACGATCRDLATDRMHCGMCGAECAEGELCVGGRCAATCPRGQSACTDGCFDLQRDPGHCGRCDRACAAGQRCAAGLCEGGGCPTDTTLCSGRCVATATDPRHCGRCDNACPGAPRAAAVCVAGSCRTVCDAGAGDCDGNAANGCETSLRTSASHCGACGNDCAAGRSCVDGTCRGPACPMDRVACGAVCVDTRTDARHCGSCERACPTGQSCASGTCVAPPTFPGVQDYDLAGDGSIFAIGTSAGTVVGRCFRPDGTFRGPAFTVATTPNLEGRMQVVTARRAGTSLVTWIALGRASDFQTRTLYSRLYDDTCTPLTDAFAWPSPPQGEYVYDTAIDQDGAFVLFWHLLTDAGRTSRYALSFFNARGVRVGDDLVVDTGSCQRSNGYAMHVALSPSGNRGVVSCQGHQSDPIYYRRFVPSTRAFLDGAMVLVPETRMGRSSWYESHQLGMNDDGAFVIEWENAMARRFDANFYTADGALVRHVGLGPVLGSFYWDAFRFQHQSAQLAGRDFILRSDPASGGSAVFWRYSARGELAGCARSALRPDTLRTGGGAHNPTLVDGGMIRRNAIDLSSTAGCP